jgi:transcriptional regulator with XRE-family HTH domain
MNKDMESDSPMNIGTRIRDIRKGLGLSIRQLAEKAGISYLTMQKIETDKVSPSVILLYQIAECLHHPVTSFIQDKEKSFVHIKKDEQKSVKTKMMDLRMLVSKGAIDNNVAVSYGKTEKGRVASRHRNDGYEFAFLLKGSCIFKYGDKKYELHEGDAVYFDASEWHSVTALEPHEFLGIHFYSKKPNNVKYEENG